MSQRFTKVGERPCLNFANTFEGWRGGAATDRLKTYGDLVDWSVHAGLVDDAQAAELRREAGRRTSAADRVLDRAVNLREAFYRIVSRKLNGEPPAAADMETLNAELSLALARSRVTPASADTGFAWDWTPGSSFLDRVLWPVARSAAEFLTSDELQRVRECAADDCNDLFLDATKNQRRRWCTMESCGNRAKARRYREKKGR